MTSKCPFKHPTVVVKPITSNDLPATIEMLGEFAIFEDYAGKVRSTAESLAAALLGPQPVLRGFIAYQDGEAAGMILGCDGYSTFAAKRTLVIEDLYVRASSRGGGVGLKLISAFARYCVDHDYADLHWRVLADNARAVRFYGSIGAAFSSDRQDCALSGAALQAVADGARAPAMPGAG
jgi:GNAT superfamily N-acetyltransferase